MKNYTGSTLQWKGKNYPPLEEVPSEIAQEMQLKTFPDQVKGEAAQGGSPPPSITDPYDPRAIASLERVAPPMVTLTPGELEPTMQSAPNVSYGQIADLDAIVIPDHLKPPEQEEETKPPEPPPLSPPPSPPETPPSNPFSSQEEPESQVEEESEGELSPKTTTTTKRAK